MPAMPTREGVPAADEALIADAQRGDEEACAVIDEYARIFGLHSPSWHAMRRTGLGGSDWAAALGLNPYRKPIDVYAEKVGEAEPFAGNERTRWGTILEAPIADEYQRLRGGPEECRLDGPFDTMRGTANSWHLYTVDRLVMSGDWDGDVASALCGDLPAAKMILRVVEIKSRGFFMRREYGDEGTDEIPFADLCQGACYVSGVECDGGVDVAALFNTHELRVFHAERDLDLEGSLLEQLGKWWRDHVVARVPPDADGSDQYRTYLRRRFDKTTHFLLEPNADAVELHRQLRSVECLARAAKAAKELLRQRLQVQIGDANGFDLAAHGGGKSMFKHDSRGKVSHLAAADELAERLNLSHDEYTQLQNAHRGAAARKWYSPRKWLKDELGPGELGTSVAEVLQILAPEPEPKPE